MSPAWYLRRLRGMSPGEVAWRAQDLAWRRAWTREHLRSWADLPPRPPGTDANPAFATNLADSTLSRVPPEVCDAVVVAADGILRGEWDVLGVRRKDIADPDWFLDVVTGVRAPSQTYAFSINHRDESQVGNIKSLWEISRHHHLTLLAAAYWVTGNDAYAKAVDGQLRSWWEENPFLSGINWTSGIEIGIRLMSWAWIRRLLDGWQGAAALFEQNGQALWQIWWHQRYLQRFRSRGSSANNHVIAEAAGLVTGASAFPWYAESPSWHLQALTLLETELARNTFPSGVNRELASEYHGFVAELAFVAAAESAAAGRPVSDETWALLGRMADAAAALVDVRGRPPRQGDGDDGRALVVDPLAHGQWFELLGVAESLLGRAEWWGATRPSLQAVLLGELHGGTRPTEHAAAQPTRFTDAGITMLRTPRSTAATDSASEPPATPEIWCRCDAGPHGFLSIAAHGHADALSIELRHNGVDILADPGTYCYHGEPQWRSYFRSTRAHNTLEVEQADQSVSGGPFLWTRQARSVDLTGRHGRDPQRHWVAAHDGYRHGPADVVHARQVSLDDANRMLSVSDRVAPAGGTANTVGVRLHWHLGPQVQVSLDGAVADLSWRDGPVERAATIQLPPALNWSVHRGESDPVLGWYSPSFGTKEPASTLAGVGELAGETILGTNIHFVDP
jgi:hypothetical protein